METVEALETITELPSGTIAVVNGQTVALVTNPSREGWNEIRSALAKLGFDLATTHLRQLGWWADGAELWLIEAI